MLVSCSSVWLVFVVLLYFHHSNSIFVQCDHSDDVLSIGELRNVYRHKSASTTTGGAFRLSSTVSSSMVVMVPSTTAGPYPEDISDYPYTSDLIAAAKAGASGVTTDRTTVVNAVPFSFVLNVYGVSGSTATPLVGADVFIWHCDALGIYSSVALASAPTNIEDTTGQFWLRGYQTVNSSGMVVFNTIVPGWYTPRALHYHIRVRLADAASNTTFAVTTQLFISQSVTNTIAAVSPYTSDTQSMTALASDMVYTSISDSTLATELILNASGSTTAGYTATFDLGITSTSTSTTAAATSSATTTVAAASATTNAAATSSATTTAAATSSATTTAAATSSSTTTAAAAATTTSTPTTAATTASASSSSTTTASSGTHTNAASSLSLTAFTLIAVSLVMLAMLAAHHSE